MEESCRAWVFDVDGCLVDSQTGASLRPLARDLLGFLRGRQMSVVLWSAGGEDYARRRARGVGIEPLITAFYSKEIRGPDGRWCIDHLSALYLPATFVDDWPEELPLSVRSIAVSPYIADNPHDRGLESAVEVARAEVMGRRS